MDGGSGAGVSINPVAFLVVQNESVKLLPITHSSAIDKLLDYVPELFDKMNNIMCKTNETKTKDESKKTSKEIEKELKEEKKVKNKKEPKEDITDTTYEFEYDETKETEEDD